MTEFGMRLDLPAGWLELPEPDADLDAWASSAARRRLSGEPGVIDPDALRDHLLDLAADSASRRPLLAAAFLPVLWAPVVAVLEVWPLAADPDSPFTPQALAAEQRAATDGLVREPDVQVIMLPAGPAVRVRRLHRAPTDRALQRAVQEELTFLLLPPGVGPQGLLLTASWLDLASGDELAAEVTAMVEGLRVVP